MSREDFKRRLIEQRCLIDQAQQARRDILAEAIPEYHFLTHAPSMLWEDCKKSPVGICVWKLEDDSGNGLQPNYQCCYYCGNPQERK